MEPHSSLEGSPSMLTTISLLLGVVAIVVGRITLVSAATADQPIHDRDA